MNRLFLHGVNTLNNILQEKAVAPIWRSEELTSNASILTRFIEVLTRGHVQVDPERAQRAINRPPSNRHRDTSPRVGVLKRWQVDAINKIVEPRAWRIYEKLGYKTPDFVALTPVAWSHSPDKAS